MAINDFFRRCDGISRRDMLRVGSLSALGLGMQDIFRMQRATAASGNQLPVKAKSCIVIWLDGGPSHLETYDLKPNAPSEVRGPFNPIPTSVPGIEICEHMPRTAEIMDKAAIIRSMTSPLAEHNLGTNYMMTGYKPTPVVEYASHGSVLAHLRPNKDSVLPPYVAVPNFRVGGANFTGNGFLPSSCRPFSMNGMAGDNPRGSEFTVKDLDFYPGVTDTRIERRREFLNALDQFSNSVQTSKNAPSDPEFEQAYRLITSPEAKKAFDYTEEPREVRNRYGDKPIGISCLIARRLVEQGVSFVTVNNRGWDTHTDVYTRLLEGYTGAVANGKRPMGLIPALDNAFSGLVHDLEDRGLLESTLVVVMGEFGRTPKLNTANGRDHWSRVFSVLVAGGGIRGGQVIGTSDSVGEGPADRPVTPSDLARTMYTLFGIDPLTDMHTVDGRPVQVNADGKVITELIA